MSANFQITDSKHNPILLVANNTADEIAVLLDTNKAFWLCVGDVTWDDKSDDVVGVRTTEYNDEVHGMLRAASDTFFWNLYEKKTLAVDGVKLEYHAYTNRKQGGISDKAGVIRCEDTQYGWASVDFVGNVPMVSKAFTKNTKNDQGRWVAHTEPSIPEAQARRHNLVSYFLGKEFTGLRIRLAPWTYGYVAAFLSQWGEEDKVAAWQDRSNRISNAIVQNREIRPGASKAFNADGGRDVAKESVVVSVTMTDPDGNVVRLADLPAGRYQLQMKQNGTIVSNTLRWEGDQSSNGLVETAALCSKFYNIVLPK